MYHETIAKNEIMLCNLYGSLNSNFHSKGTTEFKNKFINLCVHIEDMKKRRINH